MLYRIKEINEREDIETDRDIRVSYDCIIKMNQLFINIKLLNYF